MKRNEIFEKVNEVISILENIPNDGLQEYLLMEINSNNYACEANWLEFLEQYGGIIDEGMEEDDE